MLETQPHKARLVRPFPFRESKTESYFPNKSNTRAFLDSSTEGCGSDQKAKASGIALDHASWKEDLKCWAAENGRFLRCGVDRESARSHSAKNIRVCRLGSCDDGNRRVSAKSFAEGMCAER